MESNKKILLVEDDQSLGYLLSEYLGMKDFDVVWNKNGKEALETLGHQYFDLAVLDLMMPEMDGFTLAGHLKELRPELPFLFLTARSLKIDVLKGFALGAVDYLKKPIDEEELVVRIQTLLKNLHPREKEPEKVVVHKIGDYEYDYKNLELKYGDHRQQLTSRENELLNLLVTHIGTVCTHKTILNALWGKNDYFNRKSLNVFISRLRKYLEKDKTISIDNIHNQGFILRVER
ncbi:response regulator transcription factor [Robertkochia solimangrovi]|uniref:response regulator transcription factor n=1 Tax=Robertkochia solimangrovi TaxID=2213046 RepID=UPI0011814C9B|nr:response regulator transcription factor [Robertkochia solimangrovi]TRZ43305.1 DNA-binding response regulator [Robertkochia solimangrovi]